MNNLVISATDLKVSYGQDTILHVDNLNINREAGIVALLGPNGAGKSSLLKTIVGDIGTYTGLLNSPDRTQISYLPDHPFLYPWLSINQCRELFENRYNDFRNDVFAAFLKNSNLKSDQHVGELSRGMSERLHFALIMSRSTPLYVFDEPFSGIDPVTHDHLIDLMLQFRPPSAPILLSTHLISSVDAIFHEIILITNGKLHLHDSAEKFKEYGHGDMEAAYKRSVRKYE